jgi:hypothetical protein
VLLTSLAVGFTVALVGAGADIARTGCLGVGSVGCFTGVVRFDTGWWVCFGAACGIDLCVTGVDLCITGVLVLVVV